MLVFSLTPAEVQATTFGFLFFVLAIATFFILTSNYRDEMARRYAYVALFGALVNLFAFLYGTTDNLWLARFFRILSQGIVMPFVALLLLFSVALYEKYMPKDTTLRYLAYLFSLGLGLFFPLFLSDAVYGTHFLFGELTLPPSIQLTPQPGPYFFYYIIVFTLSALYSLYLMVDLWRHGRTHEAKLMGFLMVIAMNIPVLTRTVGYAPWYGLTEGGGYSLLFVSLLTGPLFAFGVTYAILRHKVFNLRLITAELLIFALWSFIFLRALLARSWSAAFPDIALLAATIILGSLLIRSVLKEVEQKERLEQLAGELRDLNENLEGRVRERTAELARSKAHIEAVVENLTVGLVEYDDSGRVYRLNRRAEELLDLSRTKVLGKAGGRLPLAVYMVLSANKEHDDSAKESPLPENTIEILLETPHKRNLQITTVPIELEDGGKGHVKLLRDITRERTIERNKSEFISTAAHQLRTPLAALRWSFETFLGGGMKRLTKSQREILEQGKSASINMIRVVNDLLNAARIEEGRFEYEFKREKLSKALELVEPTLLALAIPKNIALTFGGFDKIPAFMFDANKLMLAIQNLVDNAIKYSPEHGRVAVRAHADSSKVSIAVSDAGIGIPEADMDRLFTKFFRSKKATMMFTDGSGLGLFIVKNIVDKHGGTIVVDSKVGKGTTFTITIPTKR